jgi:hypothetical protein
LVTGGAGRAPRNAYFAGLDLGQAQDFTALAVVERAEIKGEWDAVAYCYRKVRELRLRHLERMPLGTPYPEMVARVRHVMGSAAVAGSQYLAVDGTGVGVRWSICCGTREWDASCGR